MSDKVGGGGGGFRSESEPPPSSKKIIVEQKPLPDITGPTAVAPGAILSPELRRQVYEKMSGGRGAGSPPASMRPTKVISSIKRTEQFYTPAEVEKIPAEIESKFVTKIIRSPESRVGVMTSKLYTPYTPTVEEQKQIAKKKAVTEALKGIQEQESKLQEVQLELDKQIEEVKAASSDTLFSITGETKQYGRQALINKLYEQREEFVKTRLGLQRAKGIVEGVITPDLMAIASTRKGRILVDKPSGVKFEEKPLEVPKTKIERKLTLRDFVSKQEPFKGIVSQQREFERLQRLQAEDLTRGFTSIERGFGDVALFRWLRELRTTTAEKMSLPVELRNLVERGLKETPRKSVVSPFYLGEEVARFILPKFSEEYSRTMLEAPELMSSVAAKGLYATYTVGKYLYKAGQAGVSPLVVMKNIEVGAQRALMGFVTEVPESFVRDPVGSLARSAAWTTIGYTAKIAGKTVPRIVEKIMGREPRMMKGQVDIGAESEDISEWFKKKKKSQMQQQVFEERPEISEEVLSGKSVEKYYEELIKTRAKKSPTEMFREAAAETDPKQLAKIIEKQRQTQKVSVPLSTVEKVFSEATKKKQVFVISKYEYVPQSYIPAEAKTYLSQVRFWPQKQLFKSVQSPLERVGNAEKILQVQYPEVATLLGIKVSQVTKQRQQQKMSQVLISPQALVQKQKQIQPQLLSQKQAQKMSQVQQELQLQTQPQLFAQTQTQAQAQKQFQRVFSSISQDLKFWPGSFGFPGGEPPPGKPEIVIDIPRGKREELVSYKPTKTSKLGFKQIAYRSLKALIEIKFKVPKAPAFFKKTKKSKIPAMSSRTKKGVAIWER